MCYELLVSASTCRERGRLTMQEGCGYPFGEGLGRRRRLTVGGNECQQHSISHTERLLAGGALLADYALAVAAAPAGCWFTAVSILIPSACSSMA